MSLVRLFMLQLPVVFGVLALLGAAAGAAVPAAQVLPRETKAYVSVPDLDELQQRWNATQLGQLAADPVMQPFGNDLQRQLRERLVNARLHVQIDWDLLTAACGGELALAAVQPEGDEKQHASVLLIETTGRQDAAQRLIDDIAGQLRQQGAQRSTAQVDNTELIIHDLPRQRGQATADRVIRFWVHEMLVVCNHEGTARQILQRIQSPDQAGPSLASLDAFQQAMQRVAEAEPQQLPQIRWFLEPFGYAQVVRQARGGPARRGKDMIKILQRQGFDAIRGVAGHIHLDTGGYELMHQTMVYAPPVSGASQKYELAARMLRFPNVDQWQPISWLPRDLATYASFHWEMAEAFDYSETLVDAIAGDEGFFRDLLTSIKEDPNGPQIDVRNELVGYLGQRVTIISDYTTPITPKSERILGAIELTDAVAVQRTLHKALDSDPDAEKHQVNGHVVWEIISREEVVEPDLNFDAPLLDDEPGVAGQEEERRLLANSALTVFHGHLLVCNNIEYLREILQLRPAEQTLAQSADFRSVMQHLQQLAGDSASFRFFSRTDEAYRPTYELIRQGKMPEAESMLGKLLNWLLGPDEREERRQQQIDGTELPDYDVVRRYLGPAGVVVRTEEAGWLINGIVLHKSRISEASRAVTQTEELSPETVDR